MTALKCVKHLCSFLLPAELYSLRAEALEVAGSHRVRSLRWPPALEAELLVRLANKEHAARRRRTGRRSNEFRGLPRCARDHVCRVTRHKRA
eukprot:scaffold71271_cov59-Phaeocystis_antarctica.AAC.3